VGRLPLVRHTLSEETLLRQIDEGLNGPSAAARWLSYPDAVVQQLRVAARSAGLSEMDDYSTPDGSRRRILILTDYMSSRELHELSDSVARITSQFLPANVRASVQGTTVLWANMGLVVRHQLQTAAPHKSVILDFIGHLRGILLSPFQPSPGEGPTTHLPNHAYLNGCNGLCQLKRSGLSPSAPWFGW